MRFFGSDYYGGARKTRVHRLWSVIYDLYSFASVLETAGRYPAVNELVII